MKTYVLAALLMTSSAHAQEICDFEHHCYPGQVYHMDPAHPDRITPPPAPTYQYHPKTVQPPIAQSSGPVCHMATISHGSDFPNEVVEICVIPDDQARIYHNMQRQREAQEFDRQRYVPDVWPQNGRRVFDANGFYLGKD